MEQNFKDLMNWQDFKEFFYYLIVLAVSLSIFDFPL